MFKHTCNKCGARFHLSKARVDAHWRELTTEPAYTYCPSCGEVLEGVLPRTVDLAKTLNFKFMLVVLGIAIVSFIALISGHLPEVGPLGIALFGIYLFKWSTTKDHRYIGLFLIIVALLSYLLLMAYS